MLTCFFLQRSNYVGIKGAAVPTRPLNQAVANCHVRESEWVRSLRLFSLARQLCLAAYFFVNSCLLICIWLNVLFMAIWSGIRPSPICCLQPHLVWTSMGEVAIFAGSFETEQNLRHKLFMPPSESGCRATRTGLYISF